MARKGFMFARQRGFPRSQPPLTAEPVDKAAIGDRNQPRAEGPGRIVSLPYAVYCQQDVLHRRLSVARVTMPRCGKGTEVRRHLLEEAAIGIAIAILSAGHQYRPFEVATCGRPTWTALTTARSVLAAQRHPHEGHTRPGATRRLHV